ncbi:DNA damage-binding protein 1 [Galdieria sulphuraria]|nr:DNA damage-binding protein 1 [Galdieria sulphuraria]
MYNYVVTAHKASAVTHAAVGSFLSPNNRDLILGKCSRMEIYSLSSEGLVPVIELPIYGRISVMKLCRFPDDLQDSLFFLTEKYKFAVLRWNTQTGECDTIAGGDVHDRIGHPTSAGHIGICDPSMTCFGLHLYDGLFKVIPTDFKKEAFNIRLEELDVLDIQFLYGHSKPTIAVLYTDSEENRHLKTYTVSLKDKDFGNGPLFQGNLESGASMLIPVPTPIGGVVVLGQETVTYISGSGLRGYHSIPVSATIFRAYGRIDKDGTRYLLGDEKGILYLLVLEQSTSLSTFTETETKITGLKIQTLGETSLPSTIDYLDNGFVYIGSCHGDSQLIRLLSEPHPETGSFLEVMETYPNLSPIVDFCVMDAERQGQGQVVTCSGAAKDGSLRIIRNGIGIHEQASVEVPGVKELFSLKRSSLSSQHSLLLLSFASESRVLELVSTELMAEANFPVFEMQEPTLYCGNVVGDCIVQITPSKARLISCEDMSIVNEWHPPSGFRISVASGNSMQLIIATTGGNLIYFDIDANPKRIMEKSYKSLEYEICSLDISPLGQAGMNLASQAIPSSFVAVGMWTEVSIRFYSLPSLDLIHTEKLGLDVIARSLLFVTMDGEDYFLAALGDGRLLTYRLDKSAKDTDSEKKFLYDQRQMSIGTQPASLSIFETQNALHVFAACDRPTVIHSSSGGGKLLCSNVNLREVTRVCSFSSEAFPDCLALVTEGSLLLGTVDNIQKLHIRTIPLGEQPRRIAHLDTHHVFAVLTTKQVVTISEDGNEALSETTEEGYVRLIDDTMMEIVHSYKLEQFETPCSVITVNFGDDAAAKDNQDYFVVGTAYSYADEPEPSRGRMLVFAVREQRLTLVAERTFKGALYSMDAFNGKILASVNSMLKLVRWSETESGARTLTEECTYHGSIFILQIKCLGDFILIGDLVRSVSLLAYKPMNGTIEDVARDIDPSWITVIEMLDLDYYISAENCFNLFTLKRNSDASTEEERSRLEKVGEYHLGELVNRIRHGRLVLQIPESGISILKTLLYGTANGALGVIASIDEKTFQFLHSLQTALNEVIKGVGGIQHEDWRRFTSERRIGDSKNFLDGDLIERFLDLSRDKMELVAKKVNVPVEELAKQVEELTRIH